MIYFTAHTFKCVCHCIRTMFRVLGVYNFGMYLEHDKIDRNELQIRTNSQKGTGLKIAENLNNFENFERKKGKFQPCSLPRDLLTTGQMP